MVGGQHFVAVHPRLPMAHPAPVTVALLHEPPLAGAPHVTHAPPQAACASASLG